MRQATDPAKEASLDEKARQLAERERQFIESYRYELIGELPRLEGYARTALERATERFPSERTTARRFLEHDVPRRILWLSAVISFLENAPVRERYQFVKTDDWARHDKIVRGLLQDCGFRDQHGVWIWIR